MKRKAVVALLAGAAILAIAFSLVLLMFVGGAGRPPATTSAVASPAEVTFLELPPTAKSIRYWDHWHNRIAVFGVTEPEFRATFPSVSFVELSEARGYFVGGFGDPNHAPWEQNILAEASSGLLHETIAPNGGGETILYDRETGTGFYNYAAW